MLPHSPELWRRAYHALRQKDKDVIPSTFATRPEDLVAEVEAYILQSKGKPIRVSNGENLFVRDVLQKVSRWVKRFVEVGDTVVQYDPGHAALPWAVLRLVLQMSMNNIEKHAAVLEGIETISYYLIWAKIEEACLAIPFEAHAQLELAFVQLYTTILTFAARSLHFLRNKPHRIVTAFYSSGSKFQKDVEQMASQKQSIESYVQQISDQTNQKQYAEILSVQDRLADLNQPITRIEDMVYSTSATLDRADKRAVLDWASEIPFQKHFKLAREKALAGTGEWLFQDPEFTAWQACSRSQMLWLHGSAGTGKGTLLSMVVQSLIGAHQVCQTPYPIYFFCSRNTAEPERADPEYILRSLMRQASDLPGGPLLHHILKDRYDNRRVEGDVAADEAVKIVISTIESRPITYIVIDALDECERGKRDILIDARTTILTESNSLVKIFVTSRDNHQDIVWAMGGFPALCIDASRNQADIVHYVQDSVERAIKKKKLLPTERVTADVQQAIVDSLCKGADGMFRWVELQLEFLYTLRKTSILLKRLDQLPPGLEKIYDELYGYNIRELGEEQAEVVKKIFSWLLIAKIPLTTGEMCRLVCAPDEADMSIETVLDMTFDMVRVDTEQGQFRFSHLSVREFLEKRQEDFGLEILHSMATCTCLTLLTKSETIDTGDYAALYWPAHAAEATEMGGGKRIERPLEAFLRTQNNFFQAWNTQTLHMVGEINLWDRSPVQQRLVQALGEPGSPLLVAACYSLSTHVHRVISDAEQPVDIQLKNSAGECALHLASQYGSGESVRALLDAGADVDARAFPYGTALQVASHKGHTDVVRLLLDKGADTNVQRGKYGTALQAASNKGYMEIVKLLLRKGADVNAEVVAENYDEFEGLAYTSSALKVASSNGNPEIVKLLLDRGANVNALGPLDRNALHTASYRGNAEVVRLLLDGGADVHVQDRYFGNALQAAAYNGNSEVVGLLIDAGADVNTQGGRHSNALQAASLNGNADVVQLLLDRGANVNAEGTRAEGHFSSDDSSFPTTALLTASYEGHTETVKVLLDGGADSNARAVIWVYGWSHPFCTGTALQAASNGGHTEMVRLLLDKGADVNAPRGSNGTALQTALRWGNVEIVKLLLDGGADPNAPGDNGTALQDASIGSNIEIVQLLIDSGADINAPGGLHGTALLAACNGGNIEMMKLLIDRGADIDAHEGCSDAVLPAASRFGRLEIVKLLLDSGADINAHGDHQYNALQAALSGGYIDVVQLLLDKGAELKPQEESWSSVIWSASNMGNVEIMKLLIDAGADVNTKLGNGSTALSAASFNGRQEMVKLLLDAGADVNEGGALTVATLNGKEEVVKLLLDAGADVNASGGDEGSALRAAMLNGNEELMKLLLNAGADVNALTRDEDSEVQAALERGRGKLVRLLL